MRKPHQRVGVSTSLAGPAACVLQWALTTEQRRRAICRKPPQLATLPLELRSLDPEVISAAQSAAGSAAALLRGERSRWEP